MKLKDIILIGAGGHAFSCIDIIESHNKYNIAGLVDNKKNIIYDFKYPLLGNDADLVQLKKSYKYAFVTIGQIKDPTPRIDAYKKIETLKFIIPKIISPNSYVSNNTKIESGTIIMHHCLINSEVKIGKNCIINSKALIEHNTSIGDNCHISTGCIINGNSNIGQNTFVGSGSVINNNIDIGKNCIIPSGSIVKKNLLDNTFFDNED